MSAFAETGLEPAILKAIQELGFETPTPIQAKTIPLLLTTDKDIIGLAQTGTGKTAAFGLPAIQMTDLEDKSTQTLILCPTRELCLQITRDLESYSKFTARLGIVAVYGGSSIDKQIKALKREAQIVVATPGRARDLIKRKKLILSNVGRVILDEADEMLTMGFKEELDAILAETPEKKQTLLFSATLSREIANASKKYMTDPVEIKVAKINIGAENVQHIYYMVQAKDRYEVVKRIADVNPNIYGIVFCRTRMETKQVADKLMQDGYNADALHGDLSQAIRDEVMGRFRKRNIQILVATDVAARGLDVNELTHVINYKLPDSPEIYTHRSGRTGRAGKSGISIAIIHSREGRKLQDIERRSSVKFKHGLVPTGKEICKVQLYALIDRIENVEIDEQQIEPFLPAIEEKLGHLSKETLIKHFVSAEFNRFLAYYKNARDINVTRGTDRRDRRDGRDRDRSGRDRNDRRGRDSERRREKQSKSERRLNSFTRLFVNAGSKNNLNPTRLITIINKGLKSNNVEIGKIEILKKFSFFEIEQSKAKEVASALKGVQYEDFKLSVEEAESKEQYGHFPKKKKSKKRSEFEDKDRGSKTRKKRKSGNKRNKYKK